MDNLEFKSRLASEYCFGQGLENGIAMTNSCAILLGILIRDLQLGFRFGMVITRTWVVQLVLVAALVKVLVNGIASTNSCILLGSLLD